MSPTSLANRGLAGGNTKRPHRPLRLRFASLVSSLPPPARAVLAIGLVLLTWRCTTTTSDVAASSRSPGLERRAASVRFASSSPPRPVARVSFANGAVQDISGSSRTNDDASVVYEAVWESSGIVNVEIPVGGRLRWKKEDGAEGELHRGRRSPCLKGVCKGIEAFRLEWDVLLGLRQMRFSDVEEPLIYHSPPAHPSFAPNSVSLVTQFTVSRLSRFERMLRTWDGPLSATIYLTDPSDIPLLESHLAGSTLSAEWKNVALTIVKPDFSSEEAAVLARLRYPINKLRNLAIEAAPTPHILVIDVDFIPSPGMHDLLATRGVPLLSQLSSRNTRSPTLQRTALVVPTFALVPTFNSSFPSTLAELATLYFSSSPLVTLTDANAGHGPSLPSLLFSPPPLDVPPSALGHVQPSWSYEVCFEPQWEPYYLLVRSSHLRYDERFTDQGGDKQSHAILLNALGYEFRVMRDVWVVHPPKTDKGEEEWPAARLAKRAVVEKERQELVMGKEEEDHFNLEAQRDETRFRYFQDFLPEMERNWGALFRWSGGCSARSVAQRSFGRMRAESVFGV